MSTIKIKIGETQHIVDPSKIPYFQSYLRFRENAGQNISEPAHSDIPLFNLANYGIEYGFHHLFRKLPADLDTYYTLCSTLDFLGVDVLKKRSTRDLLEEIKSGEGDEYNLLCGYYMCEEGDKTKAEDSAFGLLYRLLLGDIDLDGKESQDAYDAVFYVVSHPQDFHYRVPEILRAAFEERFRLSRKQIHGLGEWDSSDGAQERQRSDSGSQYPCSCGVDLDSEWFEKGMVK